MGTYTAQRSGLTCNDDHVDGTCMAEHEVSASYSRTSEMVVLKVDGQSITMPVYFALRLNVCIAEMLANGGV